MKNRPGFDVARARLADFDGALERLDAQELRDFMRSAARSELSSRSLVEPFVEFAARRRGGLDWAEDDPTLAADTDGWARSTRRTQRVDLTWSESLLERACRMRLSGRPSNARRCFDVVLAVLAEAEAGLLGEQAPVSPRDLRISESRLETVEGLVTPLVFGSYLVSVYEDSARSERVAAIFDAVVRLSALGSVASPLKRLEEAAVRPLEGFDDFIRGWTDELESRTAAGFGDSSFVWTPAEALLAEALERVDGLDGVARLARRSGELAHYRTWIVRLADQSQWSAALDVVEEADGGLSDPFARATVLDAGSRFAHKIGDLRRSMSLAERAFTLAPKPGRLVRWLLVDDPEPARLRERLRSARDRAHLLTPRMRALVGALSAEVGEVAQMLDDSDELWDDEAHPGPVAYPALLVAFYGGPKGTPIAANLCAPFFGGRGGQLGLALDDGHRWASPANDWDGAATPLLGPPIVGALLELEGSGALAGDLEQVPRILRSAAARRAMSVLANKDRSMYESAALLAVAAAEATFRAGAPDLARSYLADLAAAQAAARQSSFRTVLTRTLAKSALVNEL